MLHTHRSERTDPLVQELAVLLGRGPSGDPFVPEVVAVPTRGVERWLAQRLSHVLGARAGAADGVCANVRFPRPRDVVATALAGVSADPALWQPERLVWVVLEALDAARTEPWLAPVDRYLSGGRSGTRRILLSRKLARLFDAYASNRPGMVASWAAGEDGDGMGGVIPADLRWQPELWRSVRELIGAPSPAEALTPACRAMRESPGSVPLPERLSLFGPTRLDDSEIQVFLALAEHRDVHLWLPLPSPVLWDRIATYGARAGDSRRHRHPSADLVHNPLLASLGRDAREMQVRLALATRAETGTPPAPSDAAPSDAVPLEAPAVMDHHHPVASWPDTVLGRLQRSLVDDVAPEGARPVAGQRPMGVGDSSLVVHACHGPQRQVEVLREVVVGLLADDPTLEPRDILVMCPDVESYAPLVSAVFGLEDGAHPGHRVRVGVADRDTRRSTPLLGVLARILELADSRVSASALLDLLAEEPVRTRFGISDSDLDRAQLWVSGANIRWGLDAAHRRAYGLEHVEENTWRTGLDRILLGVAMEDASAGPTVARPPVSAAGSTVVHSYESPPALPLDDVDGQDIVLAGRIAEYVARVGEVVDEFSGRHSVTAWADRIDAAVASLTLVGDRDSWQGRRVGESLRRLVESAGSRAHTAELTLPEVRALLSDGLALPTGTTFQTGRLTLCSLAPMRAVPYRVMCLLGLDDGAFPRGSVRDGDDVLARDPLVGEPDPRGEDRQILLDAVMSARERLVILYTGADPRTNAVLPPAVPVGEIIDAVDSLTVSPYDSRDDLSGNRSDKSPCNSRTGAAVVVHHPLQPFDARNFAVGELGRPGPFSHDAEALRGAVSASLPRRHAAPFLSRFLSPPDVADELALADLVAFVEGPVTSFLARRLGISPAGEDAEVVDRMSAGLDSIGSWRVGDALLTAILAGETAEAVRRREVQRGGLPPGALGDRTLDTVMETVMPLVELGRPLRGEGVSTSVEVSVPVPRGGGHPPLRVGGVVPGVVGGRIVRISYSRLAPKHRIRSWVHLLALTAAYPDTAWTSATLGRNSDSRARKPASLAEVSALTPGDAVDVLATLVDLYARGMREPLPIAPSASLEYAARRLKGDPVDDVLPAVRKVWKSDSRGREADARAMVWGPDLDLDDLLELPPRSDEAGWCTDESTRFGAMARRLYEPLLTCEKVVHQ